MKIAVIIPARMESSRFPGKPLTRLLGRPMIEHVYRRSLLCPSVQEVVIATCNDEIAAVSRGFGGKVVMTSREHKRASDRIAEAANEIAADIYIMVQGDEPMVTPEMISESVRPFSVGDDRIQCVNLMSRIFDEEDYRSPNTIKVVINNDGYALYFSRAPIPALGGKQFADIVAYKQVCIIPFTKAALSAYEKYPPTVLEEVESVDMLRMLENGIRVKMVETKAVSHAVDMPADIQIVERLMESDPLIKRYM